MSKMIKIKYKARQDVIFFGFSIITTDYNLLIPIGPKMPSTVLSLLIPIRKSGIVYNCYFQNTQVNPERTDPNGRFVYGVREETADNQEEQCINLKSLFLIPEEQRFQYLLDNYSCA